MSTIIKVTDLSKRFQVDNSQVDALNHINLEIEKGDIYGIIGMSGAGKSTFVRCLNLLEKPTEGEVEVNGKCLTKLSESELRKERKNISMIFQHFNLLMQKNVIENICFPLTISGVPKAQARKKATELLEIVGLSEKAKAYPAQLSGGQKQRIAIARALATNPKILLCDEATSALDPQTTQSILELLQKLNAEYGITVVVITHEMKIVEKICNKVAILDHGILAEIGYVKDVFSNPQSNEAKKLLQIGEHIEKMQGKKVIRIVFHDKSSYEPVVANMILKFREPVNILYAQTEDLKGEAVGNMLLQLPENQETAENMIQYLKEVGLDVQEVDNYEFN